MEKFVLDLRYIPNELSLLIKMLKCDNQDGLKKFLKEDDNNINWKKFLDLTIHHRVYPILAKKLQGYESILPPFVIHTVSKLYKRNIFNMLQLSGEMEQLANKFSSNSIKALFLKGPILGKEIYGDISLRTCGDLDLLIPIENLEDMHKLLEINGYVKDDYIQSVLGDWKWRHHHVTYFHRSKKIKIEIHWRLNPGPGKEPSFNELWERRRQSLFSTNPIYFLGREDLFLFLVSHGARHGWSRLRWLLDIHQLLEQDIDWGFIGTLVKKHDNFYVVGQSIILASQLFDTTLNNIMQGFITNNRSKSLAQAAIFYMEKMVNLHDETVPTEVYLYHRRHLFSLMSRNQKVLFILSYLYPYHIDTVTLPLPKQFHFLYFSLRPFLCLWRKVKKQELSLEEPK